MKLSEYEAHECSITSAPRYMTVEQVETDERENNMPWPIGGDETARVHGRRFSD